MDVLSESLLDVLRHGGLTEEQAEAIFEQGREAVVFALLELTKQLGEQKAAALAESHETPATPSGMKPPYQKSNKSRGRKKKPGRKKGHPGSRRQMCLVHLLRDFMTTEKYKCPGKDWPAFAKKTRRLIRPAVILRKNSYGNRSDRGADTQAVLMSIFRTLKQRGHDPITTIITNLKTHLTTDSLPPLPQPTTSDG